MFSMDSTTVKKHYISLNLPLAGGVGAAYIDQIKFLGIGGVTQFYIFKGGFGAVNTMPTIGNQKRYMASMCEVGYFQNFFKINNDGTLHSQVIDYNCLFCVMSDTSQGSTSYHRYLWTGKNCGPSCRGSDEVDLKSHRCINLDSSYALLDIDTYPITNKDSWPVIVDNALCGNGIVEWTNFEQCDPAISGKDLCTENCTTVRPQPVTTSSGGIVASATSTKNTTCLYDQTGFGTC
jgi:hypothetical protein